MISTIYCRYLKLDNHKITLYSKCARIATIFALIVILLGAYTRLTDAGLGCPDWPGCYGKLVVPKNIAAIQEAQKAFPQIPLVTAKAWAEMVHRYFAGTLGILIAVLAVWGIRRRQQKLNQPLWTPGILVGLVIFQALLGMWTVTWKVLPTVVSAHLLGGMVIVACLHWLNLSTQSPVKIPSIAPTSIRPWLIFGLILTILQIFLGAWTSTNYAALACPHFPFCQGSMFPHLEWSKAFNFLTPIGPNYEGGKLDMIARMTIQMVHRYGAFLVFCYWLPLSLSLIIKQNLKSLKRIGVAVLLLLLLQIILGVLNVELMLPIQTAVAHNGVAVLLLLAMLTAVHRSYYARVELTRE